MGDFLASGRGYVFTFLVGKLGREGEARGRVAEWHAREETFRMSLADFDAARILNLALLRFH